MAKKKTTSSAEIYALSYNDLDFGGLYLEAGKRTLITQDLAEQMRASRFYEKGTLVIYEA